uniref:JmjN domain-containing protein n=1 Tax=Guillardia theta TaxID=55529 RepID=A0A7S4KPP7_GUITH
MDGDDKTSSLLHSLHERTAGVKPSLISSVNEIPVVKPSLAEFLDLPKFMASIASLGSFYGAVKILPPEGWKSRRSYEHVDFLIRCTGSQYSRDVGLNGLYDLHAEESGAMHLSDLKQLLTESQSVDAEHWKDNVRRAELDFWRDLGVETNVIYAASCSQSTLFEPIAGAWNLAQMQHKRASTNSWQLSCQGITGLSMNMASTARGWSVVDENVCSVSYVHFGAPRSVYVVPASYRQKLEEVACTLRGTPSAEASQGSILSKFAMLMDPAVSRA